MRQTTVEMWVIQLPCRVLLPSTKTNTINTYPELQCAPLWTNIIMLTQFCTWPLTVSEVCSPVRGPRRDSESDRDDFLLRGHSWNAWHHVSLLERTLICHSINDTSAGSKNVVLQHSHLMNWIRGSQCVRPCSSPAWRWWIPSLCQSSRKHLILIIRPVSTSCDGLLSPLDETTQWEEVCPVFYQFSWSWNFGAKSLSQIKQKWKKY